MFQATIPRPTLRPTPKPRKTNLYTIQPKPNVDLKRSFRPFWNTFAMVCKPAKHNKHMRDLNWKIQVWTPDLFKKRYSMLQLRGSWRGHEGGSSGRGCSGGHDFQGVTGLLTCSHALKSGEPLGGWPLLGLASAGTSAAGWAHPYGPLRPPETWN